MGLSKRGKKWCIDYRYKGRRIREAVSESKAVADAALKKRLTQIAEDRFLDKKKEQHIKLEDFAKLYMQNYSRPNKLSFSRDQICINHLLGHFKGQYLTEINVFDVEDYKRIRLKKVKPPTVNHELKCLKAMLNKAMEWGIINEYPLSRIKLLKTENKRLRFLELEEIERLVSACEGNIAAIVTLALHTGMRRGEILSLKWRDVDFNHRLITLLRTKNGEKREIHMNDIVYDTLLAHPRNKRSQYVFSYKNGKQIRDIRGSFEQALKRAGITDFRFHDLRHTFASHLVMAGIDLTTVQELMGHKSYLMTLRYAHLSPRHKKAAVDRYCELMDTFWTHRHNCPKIENIPNPADASGARALTE
jgi:integrase